MKIEHSMTASEKNRRGTSILTLLVGVAVLYMLVQVITSMPEYFFQKSYLEVVRFGK